MNVFTVSSVPVFKLVVVKEEAGKQTNSKDTTTHVCTPSQFIANTEI